MGRLLPRHGPLREARVWRSNEVEQPGDQQPDVLPDQLFRRGFGGLHHSRVSAGGRAPC